MSDIMSKSELVRKILDEETDENMDEEEIVHAILQQQVSKNVNNMQDVRLSIGDRMADNIARFAGSWAFILIFLSSLVFWIILNAFLLTKAFDAYPFILLNLILSCVAAIQAPVIMMSQNRQEEKDRLRSQNDYKVNLKAEIIIEDLHSKLDELLSNQEAMLCEINVLKAKIDNQEEG